MLDEQSVQLPRRIVAHLDWAHLQNVAGLLESGESRTKYDPDFARSGLASEMGRLASDRFRDFHAVLSEGISTSACRDFASERIAVSTRETSVGFQRRNIGLGPVRPTGILSVASLSTECNSVGHTDRRSMFRRCARTHRLLARS